MFLPSTVGSLKGAVTLTDQSLYQYGVGASPDCYAEIYADGTIYGHVSDVWQQLSASTDWIIPNSAAPGGYEFRIVYVSGDTINFGNMTVGVWYPIADGTLQFGQEATVGDPYREGVVQLQIRAGATTIDTANYTIIAQKG